VGAAGAVSQSLPAARDQGCAETDFDQQPAEQG